LCRGAEGSGRPEQKKNSLPFPMSIETHGTPRGHRYGSRFLGAGLLGYTHFYSGYRKYVGKIAKSPVKR
jgi:hypothetical protein